ncbi:uncharacterized protein ARMOST_19722 [Armillaria ostoyae]|uniref:Uncharacterized protein n=1 Tax=Armillaria ostoyae TaxID=47428 RepID=A0A284S5C7_ARMOS|nr:uncharacterized protein ARMOST_19722 [Armillaria ostoyae]
MPKKACMLSVSPAIHIPPGLHSSAHLHLFSTPSPSPPYLGYDSVILCFMLEASPPLTLSLSPSRPLSLSLSLSLSGVGPSIVNVFARWGRRRLAPILMWECWSGP